MEKILVRRYRKEDREAVLREVPSHNPEVRVNHLQMAENCDMYLCYVSEGKNGINGFALVRNLGDGVSFYLDQITVKTDGRRKSVGTNIMKKIFEELGKGKRMSLCVNTDNEDAIEFYKSLDFDKTGYTKGYRRGQDKFWYAIDL